MTLFWSKGILCFAFATSENININI